MLFTLDPKSVLFSGVLLGLVFTLALLAARGSLDGAVRRSMAIWALGMFCHALGWSLIVERGVIADFWSVVVGNTLSVATYALFSHALRLLHGQARIPRFVYAVTAITFAVQLVLLYGFGLPQFRVPLLSALVVAMLVLAGREALLRPLREHRPGVQLVALVFLLGALILILRVPYEIAHLGSPRAPLIAEAPIQIAVYLYAALGPAVASFGYLLLCQEEALRTLRHTAATDPLTGLFNRRPFERMGLRMVAEALRRDRPLTLIVIDIDHFKTINDRYGHALGDAVLQSTAGLLQRELRDSDLIGRMGGEEFAVLLPETTHVLGLEVAERLRGAVLAMPVAALGVALDVRISLGVATIGPHGDRSGTIEDVFTDLLHRGDLAMYSAKRAGRNRVASAQDQMVFSRSET